MPPTKPEEVLVITENPDLADKLRKMMDNWNMKNDPKIHLEYAPSINKGEKQHISNKNFSAYIYAEDCLPKHLPDRNYYYPIRSHGHEWVVMIKGGDEGFITFSRAHLGENLIQLVTGNF